MVNITIYCLCSSLQLKSVSLICMFFCIQPQIKPHTFKHVVYKAVYCGSHCLLGEHVKTARCFRPYLCKNTENVVFLKHHSSFFYLKKVLCTTASCFLFTVCVACQTDYSAMFLRALTFTCQANTNPCL